MTYSTFDVPVPGGPMRVGRWSGPKATTTVVAIHGITAHHLAWALVAQELPEVDLVAPDLRGRGRSRDLPPEVGMAAHADDVAAVIREVGGPVVVVGHSMGGFVAAVLAHRHPDLVSGVVLVDGGFPFASGDAETTKAGLELIKNRLRARYPSVEDYVGLFRAHPAFVDDWSDAVENYVRYDAIGEAPEHHGSAILDAVVADQRDIAASDALIDALAALAESEASGGSDGAPVRTLFLRAPRGFVDDPPGLYSPEATTELRSQYPAVEFREIEGVNHYTITLGRRGARAVATAVRDMIG